MFIHARSAVKSSQNTQVTAFTFTSVNNRFAGFSAFYWGRGKDVLSRFDIFLNWGADNVLFRLQLHKKTDI